MPIKVPMSIIFNQASDVCAPVGAEFSGTSFLTGFELALNTDPNTLRCFQTEARF